MVGAAALWVRRRGHDLRDPLTTPDVRLLWLAKIASEIGDWGARLALAYLVLDRTGSPTATAAVTAVSLAPWLGLGQMLSTLADRFPHRSVMIAADLVRVVAFLVIAWVPMPLVPLFVVVFVAAAMSPPFEAARSACLPELTGPERYPAALMLFNATYQAGLLIGYVTGGSLVAWVGASWALTVNSGTFLVSAALIVVMRSRTRAVDDAEPRRAGSRGTWAQLSAAASVYRRDGVLAVAIGLLVLANAPVMAVEGLIVVYADAYAGGGARTAGVLSALVAAGALVGMFTLPSDGDHPRLVRVCAVVVLVVLAGSGALLWLAPSLLLGVIPLLALGSLAGLTVPLGGVLGRRLPRATRATAFSLAQGALMTTQALGTLVAGILTDDVGVAAAVALVALPALALAALVSLLGVREKPTQRMGRPPVTAYRAPEM